jgi:hypothetical protein
MSDQLLDPEHSMYGIRLKAQKGRDLGYLVKVGRRHVEHTKWFGFEISGGQENALAAAKAWRDEQTRQLEPLTKQEVVSQIRTNNTSGVAGVMRITQRNKRRSGQVWTADYWIARPPRGIKVSTRFFLISTYGEEGAKAQAIAARQEMETLCSGYHAPHVPEAFLMGATQGATEIGMCRELVRDGLCVDS